MYTFGVYAVNLYHMCMYCLVVEKCTDASVCHCYMLCLLAALV